MYRLIIVDDEDVIRNGLQTVVDWSSLGFTVAGAFGKADEALGYIRNNTVDAVLLDIWMPRLSGLDLAEVLRRESPGARIVVLSGYDNFSYAQQAIELSVFSYLLKPVKEEQIRDVFTRVRRSLDEERSTAQREESHERALLHRAMTRALFYTPDDDDLALLSRQFGLPSGEPTSEAEASRDPRDTEEEGGTKIRPLVVGVHREPELGRAIQALGDPGATRAEGREQVEARSRTGGESEPRLRALEAVEANIAEDATLGASVTSICVHPAYELWGLVMERHGSQMDSFRAEELAERILELARSTASHSGPLEVSAALGAPVETVDELHGAAEHTTRLLEHRLYLGLGRLITEEMVAREGSKEVERTESMEEIRPLGQAFAREIAEENPAGARESVERFATMFRQSAATDRSMLAADFRAFLYWVRQHLALLGASFESIFGSEARILAAADACVSLEQVQRLCEELIATGTERFRDRYGGTRQRVMVRVLEYMNAHLNRSFSLEGLAEKYGFSISHFSRLFKATVGENFKDYLVRIRMNEAKRLLAGSEKRIQEIAAAVGYRDQHYFSEAFRKHTGCTPKEYRNHYSTEPA
jgi:two-component system response regulator YesN